MIYLEGTLKIQNGTSPYLLESIIYALLPSEVKPLFYTIKEKIEAKERQQKSDILLEACMHEKEIDENDFSLSNQTAIVFMNLSDTTIQRVLRDTDNSDLATAMKTFPGQVRKRIFNNMSSNLAVMIAEDMELMGPARRIDVENAQIKILNIIIKLEEEGEIICSDIGKIKIVLACNESYMQRYCKLEKEYAKLNMLNLNRTC